MLSSGNANVVMGNLGNFGQSSGNANVVMGNLGTFANHSEEGVAPTQSAKMASVVTLIIEQNCLNSSIGNTHL